MFTQPSRPSSSPQGGGFSLSLESLALCPFLLYVHRFPPLQFSALRVTSVDIWGCHFMYLVGIYFVVKGSKKSCCKENYLMGRL